MREIGARSWAVQGLKPGQRKVVAASVDSLLPETSLLARPNGKLGARRVAVGDLEPDTIAQMWVVFRRYYADIRGPSRDKGRNST